MVCQRTPGAKAAVFPAPKLFAKLTTGSRCLAYRCDSQKHVNIHSWKCHQKNNIEFTTGLFTHLSLIRKRPHNVPPSLPALAITSAGITDFDSTIRSTAVIDTPYRLTEEYKESPYIMIRGNSNGLGSFFRAYFIWTTPR